MRYSMLAMKRLFLPSGFLVFLAAACSSSSGDDGSSGTDGGGSDASTDSDATSSSDGSPITDGATHDASTETDGAPTGPVFYVATTGDDANAGTLASPWKTLNHAMGAVPAGATIYARGGTYSESVTASKSGVAGTPITLTSYPSELAIIDGTSVPVVDGTGLITIDGQSYITIQGLEIRNWTSTTSAVPAGIFVHGGSTNISILGNHIHDIVTTVESCNGAGGNAFGLAVYGDAATPSSNILIRGNELNALKTGCSESLTINGNVDGFEVSQNSVHDNDNIGIDAIGAEGTGPSAATDQARDGLIQGNSVFNITSLHNAAYNGLGANGIYTDGAASIVIEQNTIHNVDLGIEMASEHSGKTSSYVVARNNLVFYSNSAGISIGGFDSSVGGTDHCAILNNTLYDNTTELEMQTHITSVLFENNLVYDNAGNYQDGATTGVTIDHDLDLQTGAATFFVTPGTPPNGAVAVDLHVTAGSLSSVKNLGVVVACPTGWTCPTNWGTNAIGATDIAGTARESSGMVDIGAYQQ